MGTWMLRVSKVAIASTILPVLILSPHSARASDQVSFRLPFDGEFSLGHRFSAVHSGVDICLPDCQTRGREILASAGGTARYFCQRCQSGRNAAGHAVIIHHGAGAFTRYYHLDTVEAAILDAGERGLPLGNRDCKFHLLRGRVKRASVVAGGVACRLPYCNALIEASLEKVAQHYFLIPPR